AAGVSKEHAAKKVASYLGIDFAETLGIGDSPADWNFMHLCGYAATVGGDEVLRGQAESKGLGHYFHASSVDDHGFLQILQHFELT
ncbi:MAG TPA: HAD hydrolase family protein, partial [Candidatus Saccharimonadales bacterium]